MTTRQQADARATLRAALDTLAPDLHLHRYPEAEWRRRLVEALCRLSPDARRELLSALEAQREAHR